MIPFRTTLLLATTLAVATSCGNTRRPTPDAGAARGLVGVLATVDGRPITRYDVRASIHTTAPHGGVAETEQDALERIIQEDIIAQRAIEQGLESDPEFAEQDRNALAAYHAFRRSALVTLFSRHQTAVGGGAVSDADARAFYDANAARIRTEVHVEQMLFRSQALATQALSDLQTTPFDQIAQRSFPPTPDGQRPWDLGWLPWTAIPEQWHPTIDTMAPGTNSGIIEGPNHRYWVIRLVERRERPDMTFEQARPAIVQAVQAQRTLDLRTNEAQDLRRHARIVYIIPPATTRAPAPPQPNEEP